MRLENGSTILCLTQMVAVRCGTAFLVHYYKCVGLLFPELLVHQVMVKWHCLGLSFEKLLSTSFLFVLVNLLLMD